MLAEVLRRGSDGHWPAEPEEIGGDGTLRLESIGVAFPLREAYAQTHLGKAVCAPLVGRELPPKVMSSGEPPRPG